MNNFLKLISKNEEKIKVLFILYAIYCSIKIGVSWDEKYYQIIGKINLDYLLSFGAIDENFFSKYRYSTMYWSLASLISQIAPQKFSIEIFHLINTFFGLLTIVGVYQVIKKIFNKKIAKISSILLFFTPFFFGHLAINNKDIILAFSHIWIIYYIWKYSLREYNFKIKIFILLKLSLLSALGTGVQLFFLGSLLPILLIFIINLFFFKNRNLKVIILDFLIYLTLFYIVLMVFWVDAHENIFLQPFNFFISILIE